MGLLQLKTKKHMDACAHTKVRTKWVIDVFWQMWDIYTWGWKCREGEKNSSLQEYGWLLTLSHLITHRHTQTHTYTWQGATSWLAGWLTLTFVCARLRQLLVNPHCMKQPSGSLQAHLSASCSQTSLTINNRLYVCVCVLVCFLLHSEGQKFLTNRMRTFYECEDIWSWFYGLGLGLCI